MFNNCSGLNFFKMPKFNSSNINDMTNMFKDCRNLVSLDLSDLNTSNVINMNSMFSGCSKLKELNLKNFDTSKVSDMSEMFSNCEGLNYINFENFNTSKVYNMEKMFYNCKNMQSLNINNFKTSEVNNTKYMFSGCSKLTTLNLINFDTSKIQYMNNMFENCSSLKSLDFSSFNTSSVSDMSYMFRGCNNLKNLEIYDFNTSKVKNLQYMFSDCNNLKTLDLSQFETKKCENMEGMLVNCTNLECLDLSNFDTRSVTNMKNMFSGCNNLLYLDLNSFNFTKVNNINNMFKNCNSLVYLNLGSLEKQIPINKDDVTDLFYNIFEDINICSKLTNINEIINNYNLSINCSDDCFTHKTNVLGSTKKCVESCQENDYYKYEYNHVCMDKCPIGTHHIYRNEYLCQKDERCKEYKNNIEKCKENLHIGYYLDYEDGIYKPCYRACKTCNTSGDINNNNCIEYLIDVYLEEFRTEIISYNTKKIDIGHDYFRSEENVVYTLTSTRNQNNNKYFNVSSIELNECYNRIIKQYGLQNNSNIYILKVDILLPGTKIPKVEYELYYPLNGTNLTLLNMSVCENTKIDIYLPTNISKEELYKHNPKSDFYNDICKTHTSESGTDIILNDRRNEFVDKNMNLCEEDCELTNFDNKIYNTTYNRVKCTCNTKINLPKLSKVKIDKAKLLNNFKDIKNMINISLLKCFKLLFDLNNIHKNYANYMMIFLFTLSIISIFFFIFKDYFHIKIIIKTILKEKFVNNKIYAKNNNIKEKLDVKKNKNKNEYMKIGKNKHNNLNIKKFLFKKNNNKIHLKAKNMKAKNLILRKNNNNYKYNQKFIRRGIKKIKSKIDSKSIKNTKVILLEANNIRKTTLNINKKIIRFRYNDNELNLLNYKDAKKSDKRTYMQYYFSLLKTKHLLFFSFFNFNDYNSRMIKIYIFFFNIQIEYTISAMFYTEDAMHKIHEDKGTFDILYQLPQILYSSLLSLLFTNIIGNLGLYEDDILNIKNYKYFLNNKKLKLILRRLKIKISLFFIVTYILLFCFWVYVGCFCAVYKNTQIHLLTEVLSSFGMSLITPLLFYFIPGIFRIPSLKHSKPLLYKCSKIIQFFL